MDTLQLSLLKEQLLSLRDDILHSISEMESSADVVELDQTRMGRLTRMDAMQQQAMAQALNARKKQQLPLISAALQRIAADEYGYCEDCGNNIAIARLKINPITTFCIQCAE